MSNNANRAYFGRPIQRTFLPQEYQTYDFSGEYVKAQYVRKVDFVPPNGNFRQGNKIPPARPNDKYIAALPAQVESYLFQQQ